MHINPKPGTHNRAGQVWRQKLQQAQEAHAAACQENQAHQDRLMVLSQENQAHEARALALQEASKELEAAAALARAQHARAEAQCCALRREADGQYASLERRHASMVLQMCIPIRIGVYMHACIHSCGWGS